MEPINDFKEIGKKLPYKAPDDFFETSSLKILQEAKRRESHGKMVIWRTIAAAASIAAVGFVGFYMLSRDVKPVEQSVVQADKPIAQPRVQPDVIQAKADSLPVKETAKKKNVAEQSEAGKEVSHEKLDELLADLSDEELLQMAAMVKSDPFEGVQEQ